MYRLAEKFMGAAFLCAALGSLAGCGNVSRDVAKNGHGAGQLQPVVAAPAKEKEQVFTLSTDALFAFDKHSVADITNDGKTQLNALAHKLIVAGDSVRNVYITGYTDRLGSASYNDDLSEHRAYAVMHYLVDRGVPAASIIAEGLGMTNPVKDCPDDQQAQLISCLAPNRRVVVKVDIADDDPAEVKSGT
jgi:outer membrane protein OmpA-like peptidoglycan-associated protein